MLLLLLMCSATLVVDTRCGLVGNQLPPFPNQYVTSGVLRLPYAELAEPFHVWYDGVADSSRIDYYGGVSKTFLVGGDGGVAYKTMPVTDDLAGTTNVPTCFATRGTTDQPVHAQTVMPDFSNFSLVGQEKKQGVQCYRMSSETVHGGKVSRYTLWTTVENGVHRPVVFEMRARNDLFGSHFDHYIFEYNTFHSGPPAPADLAPPAISQCRHWSPGAGSHETRYHMAPFSEFFDNELHVDAAFEQFERAHQRRYEHERARLVGRMHFGANMRLIHALNRQNISYRVAPNHLTDHSPSQLRRMRGYRYSARRWGASRFPYTTGEADRLPGQWDWRLQGAVTPVKDQASCGSCWSFGTAGHIESAHYLHQVRRSGSGGGDVILERLSQQALVDCSWGEGNYGCDGGEDVQAYAWIRRHGLPTENDYGAYLGVDSQCHVNDSSQHAVTISGHVDVPSGDVAAVRLALLRRGPLSVAIDASRPGFSFYSHGVYYDASCGNQPEQLDHAVLAVGYGEINGEPYWLVKNSWSTNWGNDGYVLMSRRNNNCGVATAATYVTFD